MTLDYFYGQAGELFSFFRIPKALFQEQRFQDLSTDAKTLYGILLDRMSLSVKNGWLDEQNRVFIIFTIEDVKRALCCADNKATKLLRELEEFGLIERKRRGLGKPSLVYVKNFSAESSKSIFQNRDFHDSGGFKSASQDPAKPRCNKTEENNTEMSETYPFYSEEEDQGGNTMRLKNDTNNFAASFNITPPYQMMVIHSSKLIYPREVYQRRVHRSQVELIAADFNEYIANEPKVSFRNGRYYVVDGQHTIEGRILRNGGKDLPILCKVYTGLTMEQEALFFAEQNGHSAPLTAGIKLRAKVVGGDAPSRAFLAATNRVGLAFNYDSLQLSDYRISCVGTALKLYNQMGEKIYCEALRLIVASWDGKPDSFRASVLRGVMHFVELYHGEFSEERLIRALGSVHPMEIYRVGRDNPAKLPGWKKYVFPIYMIYNGKGRKDALPMKF